MILEFVLERVHRLSGPPSASRHLLYYDENKKVFWRGDELSHKARWKSVSHVVNLSNIDDYLKNGKYMVFTTNREVTTSLHENYQEKLSKTANAIGVETITGKTVYADDEGRCYLVDWLGNRDSFTGDVKLNSGAIVKVSPTRPYITRKPSSYIGVKRETAYGVKPAETLTRQDVMFEHGIFHGKSEHMNELRVALVDTNREPVAEMTLKLDLARKVLRRIVMKWRQEPTQALSRHCWHGGDGKEAKRDPEPDCVMKNMILEYKSPADYRPMNTIFLRCCKCSVAIEVLYGNTASLEFGCKKTEA